MDLCHVLFVDDEKDFLETLLKRMRKRNLNVYGLNNGKDAIDFLENLKETDPKIDVVVIDVKMPGMSGIDTLKEIKAFCPCVEVIILTGHANLDIARKTMENGAFDYLMKPVDIDELLFKIQDAYKKKLLQEKTNKGF